MCSTASHFRQTPQVFLRSSPYRNFFLFIIAVTWIELEHVLSVSILMNPQTLRQYWQCTSLYTTAGKEKDKKKKMHCFFVTYNWWLDAWWAQMRHPDLRLSSLSPVSKLVRDSWLIMRTKTHIGDTIPFCSKLNPCNEAVKRYSASNSRNIHPYSPSNRLHQQSNGILFKPT